jgi:hypothetical protein
LPLEAKDVLLVSMQIRQAKGLGELTGVVYAKAPSSYGFG